MIDLVSTRPGTDPQAAACARLLVTVITQTIRDACKTPDKNERARSRNLDGDTRMALNWLFEPSFVFAAYATLIGSSARDITMALLSDVALHEKSPFTAADRRVVQLRHRWWLAERRARSA